MLKTIWHGNSCCRNLHHLSVSHVYKSFWTFLSFRPLDTHTGVSVRHTNFNMWPTTYFHFIKKRTVKQMLWKLKIMIGSSQIWCLLYCQLGKVRQNHWVLPQNRRFALRVSRLALSAWRVPLILELGSKKTILFTRFSSFKHLQIFNTFGPFWNSVLRNFMHVTKKRGWKGDLGVKLSTCFLRFSEDYHTSSNIISNWSHWQVKKGKPVKMKVIDKSKWKWRILERLGAQKFLALRAWYHCFFAFSQLVF